MTSEEESIAGLLTQLRQSLAKAKYARDWHSQYAQALRYLDQHAPRLHAALIEEFRQRDYEDRFKPQK